jgi:hypothetical protein
MTNCEVCDAEPATVVAKLWRIREEPPRRWYMGIFDLCEKCCRESEADPKLVVKREGPGGLFET